MACWSSLPRASKQKLLHSSNIPIFHVLKLCWMSLLKQALGRGFITLDFCLHFHPQPNFKICSLSPKNSVPSYFPSRLASDAVSKKTNPLHLTGLSTAGSWIMTAWSHILVTAGARETPDVNFNFLLQIVRPPSEHVRGKRWSALWCPSAFTAQLAPPFSTLSIAQLLNLCVVNH